MRLVGSPPVFPILLFHNVFLADLALLTLSATQSETHGAVQAHTSKPPDTTFFTSVFVFQRADSVLFMLIDQVFSEG